MGPHSALLHASSYRWGGGGGGPCDFSVSPSPFGLDFGTLDFETSDSGFISTYIYIVSFRCRLVSYFIVRIAAQLDAALLMRNVERIWWR